MADHNTIRSSGIVGRGLLHLVRKKVSTIHSLSLSLSLSLSRSLVLALVLSFLLHLRPRSGPFSLFSRLRHSLPRSLALASLCVPISRFVDRLLVWIGGAGQSRRRNAGGDDARKLPVLSRVRRVVQTAGAVRSLQLRGCDHHARQHERGRWRHVARPSCRADHVLRVRRRLERREPGLSVFCAPHSCCVVLCCVVLCCVVLCCVVLCCVVLCCVVLCCVVLCCVVTPSLSLRM
jgi:hypothetical protein